MPERHPLAAGWFITVAILAAPLGVATAAEPPGAAFRPIVMAEGVELVVPWALSGDGRVVVGNVRRRDEDGELITDAFRWDAAGGYRLLGDLPGGPFNSVGVDVSADGRVVLGVGDAGGGLAAFRWTAAGGVNPLPSVKPAQTFWGVAMSADAKVLAGNGGDTRRPREGEGSVWVAGTGIRGLGDLDRRRPVSSSASGISADGKVVVGTSSFGRRSSRAFIWNRRDGMTSLGSLGTPARGTYSTAEDVSADGKVVVGSSDQIAFRWTKKSGMVALGDLPGGETSSAANATSANGSVVVGVGTSAAGREAMVWTKAGGMRSVADVLLNDCEVDPGGWTLFSATDVSGDGRTILGRGVHETLGERMWLVTFPEAGGCGAGVERGGSPMLLSVSAVPEPLGPVWLVVVVAAGLTRRGRRRCRCESEWPTGGGLG